MEAKGNPVPTETLVKELRTIYRSDPLRSDVLMETFLEQRLKAYDRARQLLCLQELVDHFGKAGGAGTPGAKDLGSEEFPGCSLSCWGRGPPRRTFPQPKLSRNWRSP